MSGVASAVSAGLGVLSTGAGIYENNKAVDAQKAAIAPLQNANTDLYSKAEGIANTPYTAYTGQQVAPITGSQQQAITQAQQVANNNEAGSDIGQSEALAGQIAGNGWNSQTAQKYMNPYTQAVTDAAQKQLNQSYANVQNAAGLNAASSGAFGGDRAALTQAANTGNYMLQSGTLAAQNNAAAYNSAIQAWQADNQRASSAASAYQSAGNDITQMNSAQIKDLLATGGVEQATQQMDLNAKYNDYLDQRNWSTQELQPLLSATSGRGTPAAVSPNNTASDILGMGSALAGYFGSQGSSPNNSGPFSLNGANGTAGMVDTSTIGNNLDSLTSGVGQNVSISPGVTTYFGGGT